MKTTLTLGLLLIGGAVPALQEPAQTTAVEPTARDERAELRWQLAQRRIELEQVEGRAEIERLERTLSDRRSMREEKREKLQRIRELHLAREMAERELDSAAEAWDRRYAERERELEEEVSNAEENLEAEHDAQERSVENERESLEVALEAGRISRDEAEEQERLVRQRAESFAAQYRDGKAELRQRWRAVREHLVVARQQGEDELRARQARMADIEREVEQSELDLEEFEEEFEAQAEIRDLRAELEMRQRRLQMELECEELERRLEELEERQDLESWAWDVERARVEPPECEEEMEIQQEEAWETTDDFFVGAGQHEQPAGPSDLSEIHAALADLQAQIDDLRAEVERLWQALEAKPAAGKVVDDFRAK